MARRVADTVTVELDAPWQRYDRGLRNGERAFDRTMQKTRRSAEQTEKAIRQSQDRIADGFKQLAAGVATAATIRAVVGMSDAYVRFTNQLKVAGLEGGRLNTVQDALFGTAQRYGVELESLGTLYGRVSQAAKELGASDQDLLKFTNGVAAAIKVQGGTAEQASGALLQLSQALGGTIVRAEEYNSINEGARPILQAVANGSDRFKGSVAALRNEVIKGTVTSREFYAAFLAGSAQLEQQATRATLTTGQAFTILRNALVRYIGESDAAQGASKLLGSAMALLADNLESVIPALGILGVALGVGFVANAVRAQVAAAGVVGSMTAMRASVLAAFGGPVGIAITAVALALGSFGIEAMNAQAAAASLQDAMDSASSAITTADGYANTAATSVNSLGGEANVAGPKIDAFAGAVGRAAQQLYNLAAAKKAAALAELNTERENVSRALSENIRRTPEGVRREMGEAPRSPAQAFGVLSRGFVGGVKDLWTGGDSTRELYANVEQGRQQLREIDAALGRLNALGVDQFADEARAAAAGAGAGAGGAKKGGRGRSYNGPTPDDLRLQAQLDAARASGDESRVRALQDVLELQGRIDAYERAGLSNSDAQLRAAEDMALVIGAREQAFARERARLAETAAIEVARTSQNLEQARVLERQAELRDRIDSYVRAGLAPTVALLRATEEQARVDAARAEAARRNRADMAREVALQVASLDGADAVVQALEDQNYLRDQALRYQEQQLSMVDAEAAAQRDLLAIQEARGRALQRYLQDAEREHAIRVADSRGDDREARRLRTQADAASRVRDRIGRGQNPDDAQRDVVAEISAEARAELQGTFRDTFREGVMAALQGDLGDFFESFIADRAAAALEESLNRIADFGFDFLLQQFPQLGGLGDTASAAAEGAAEAAAQQAAAAAAAAAITAAGVTAAGSITGAGAAVAAAITAAGVSAAAAIAAASASGGGGGDAGSVVGAILGAGKARGGRTYPGTAYPVNEGKGGSEWFVPDGPGMIVPQEQRASGAGQGVSLGVKLENNTGVPMRMVDRGTDGKGERRLALEPMIDDALMSAARSGSLGRAERQKRTPTRRA